MDFDERLIFFKKELEGLFDDEEVSSCRSLNSTWKINQLVCSQLDFLRVRMPYYQEDSLSIQWEIGYLIRKSNSSWTQQKWSASAVQLDPNTWILEYSQSPLTENGKLVSAVLEFLKYRLRREVQKLKQEFWLSSSFTSQHSDFSIERLQIPT
ncbi:hypothetical protein HAX54_031596 [Datura stramonium]|uniref:Uncharacterized protein n=1 Tax=Datura stramonium TaxID=4076 RepID=A0ABS8RLA6_DATST|nr:hypothetical protein [Datura stramonium]